MVKWHKLCISHFVYRFSQFVVLWSTFDLFSEKNLGNCRNLLETFIAIRAAWVFTVAVKYHEFLIIPSLVLTKMMFVFYKTENRCCDKRWAGSTPNNCPLNAYMLSPSRSLCCFHLKHFLVMQHLPNNQIDAVGCLKCALELRI